MSCGLVGLCEGYSLAGGVGLRFRVSDFGYRTYLSAFLYCVYFVFISGIVGIDFGCISVEVHAGSDRATGSLASLFGTLLSAFHFQPRPYFCYLGMSLPLGAQPAMAMISGTYISGTFRTFRVDFGTPHTTPYTLNHTTHLTPHPQPRHTIPSTTPHTTHHILVYFVYMSEISGIFRGFRGFRVWPAYPCESIPPALHDSPPW